MKLKKDEEVEEDEERSVPVPPKARHRPSTFSRSYIGNQQRHLKVHGRLLTSSEEKTWQTMEHFLMGPEAEAEEEEEEEEEGGRTASRCQRNPWDWGASCEP